MTEIAFPMKSVARFAFALVFAFGFAGIACAQEEGGMASANDRFCARAPAARMTCVDVSS